MFSASELQRALCAHTPVHFPALPGRRNHLRAGILVPILWAPDPRCILTLRPQELSLHGGEVSFPGGRPEEGDEDLYHTARREAAEELGIRESTPLGELSNIPLYTSDYRLFPFVDHLSCGEFEPNPGEVAAVFEIPFSRLFSDSPLHAIASHHGGHNLLCPIFEWEGSTIFGGTAFVLYELLTIVSSITGRAIPPFETGKYAWTDLLPSES